MEADLEIILSKIFLSGASTQITDVAMQAGLYIIENEYVDEAPGDDGDFKQGIQAHKNSSLNYVIESTAEENGVDYPLVLFWGSGKLKGTPDQGYTTGHVRAGDVAYGIGGIRPNKAATRAKKDSEDAFTDFVKKTIKVEMKKPGTKQSIKS